MIARLLGLLSAAAIFFDGSSYVFAAAPVEAIGISAETWLQAVPEPEAPARPGPPAAPDSDSQ